MGYSRLRLRLVFFVFLLLAAPLLVSSVSGQGLMGGSGLDLAPSNPFGMPGSAGGPPGGADTLNLASRMFPNILPTIPGLEFSYLHSFARDERWSRLLVEYVRPVRLQGSTTVYGEFHGLLYEPFRSRSWWGDSVDLSAGGGYRKRFGDRAIAGIHGFYDATRRGDEWSSSVSAGGFMMTMLPGDDAIDLTVNWYGGTNTGMFGVGSGAWGQGTFDGTMTYYHELWEGGPDLQLSLIGYGVDDRLSPAYIRESGYGARVQVASRDGMFRGFYMYENDRHIKEIHTVGVYLNLGFRLENLFTLGSPIEKPTPIFASPRNLDYWQNVATGTERHLRKTSLGFWDNCDWSKCSGCWESIMWLYTQFNPGNQELCGNYPCTSAWVGYLEAHQSKYCSDYCFGCVYLKYEGTNDQFQVYQSAIGLNGMTDKVCCTSWNPG